MKKIKEISKMQFLLSATFIACLIVSNIIAIKQMQIASIILPSAVIIFPITYILSDVFSEVYGYKWSRTVAYTGLAMNLFAVAVFQLAIALPAPEYWTMQEPMKAILGNTPRILLASTLGLAIGDLVDDKVFRAMKRYRVNKYENDEQVQGFILRAITSSAVGQFCDSLLFIPIAFIGLMPFNAMLIMLISQVAFKVIYELLLSPITKKIAIKLHQYEGTNEVVI